MSKKTQVFIVSQYHPELESESNACPDGIFLKENSAYKCAAEIIKEIIDNEFADPDSKHYYDFLNLKNDINVNIAACNFEKIKDDYNQFMLNHNLFMDFTQVFVFNGVIEED
jgi:hypothetical protein